MGSGEGDRRAAIVARGRALLDLAAPLDLGSHADATGYEIEYGGLLVRLGGRVARLAEAGHFAGYRGAPATPDCILLRHHGLHIELRIDRQSAVGQGDAAGIADIVIESAVTAIIDFEDSVAIVDASDKVAAYRTLLGLARGTLDVGVSRGGAVVRRELAPDRVYTAPDGAALSLPGRALMLMRTVGHHMMTDAVLEPGGAAIPETMLDAAIGALIAAHDLRGTPRFRNGRSGSAYFVRPKMHGPEEVGFANAMFDAIEDMLALPRHILKIGIMDEERRTSVNLAACIEAARHRLVFINTGFLDRTGDEIHTLLHAGPPLRKAELQQASWLAAYETGNVSAGLACGLGGRAQIGKGMWAEPDSMAAMLRAKGAQPRAGASTAWVPSPVAATLHAVHYHEVDVAARQAALPRDMAPPLAGLLTAPLLPAGSLSAEQIAAELDLNVHCILGYVARWVHLGIGCSKLADLSGTPLMEDRATLRIASQHVAAWLWHGVVSRAAVEASLHRMAERIDGQEAGDALHRAFSPGFDGPAFRAAWRLVFEGADRPSGYTETVLHAARREVKAAGS